MATPLTDSINALTTYANEVTGASDTTLSDAVYTLASGYGQGGEDFDLFQYISNNGVASNIFRNQNVVLPSGYELRLRNVTAINTHWLYGLFYTDEVTVTFDNAPTKLASCFYGFNNGGTAGKINLNFDTSQCTNFDHFIRDCTVKEISGELDFSSATSMNSFAYGAVAFKYLEEIRFVKNTISITVPSGALTGPDKLSDDSLISIANGLNPDVSGLTVYLHSDCVTRCSSIMGTVTDGTFTADNSGSVTLADFITNTKGWTLA